MGLRENRRAFQNWHTLHLARRHWLRRDFDLRTRSGLCLRIRAGSEDARIAKSIFAKQRYTNDFVSIPRGGVVLDVGANIGAFSLFAAQCTGDAGRIFAFEPEPSNFLCLEGNLRRNGNRNVTTQALAIAGESGRRRLALASSGSHSLGESATAETLEVEARSLADWIGESGLDRIDFLKLDCEGAEIEIIDGLDADTAGRIERIALEFHPRAGHSRETLGQRLSELGFEVLVPPTGSYAFARR